jgi:riboflavin synthase
MFTGIVQAVGQVMDVVEAEGMRRIRIRVGDGFLDGVFPGASIAVDGACLTPVEVTAEELLVEAIGTTLARTVIGGYRTGSRVNLEKALRVGDRLDGHFVQGHIDGIGHLRRLVKDGEFHLMEVVLPREVHAQTLSQGSITLNGVSLTVNRLLSEDRAEVAIIPHTWSVTALRYLAVGDAINVEGDLIGKYVGTLLRRSGMGSGMGDEPGRASEPEMEA